MTISHPEEKAAAFAAVTATASGQRCETCLFARNEVRQLWCTRFPPAAVPVPHKDLTGEIEFRWQSSFPAVNPRWRCGEYKPSMN